MFFCQVILILSVASLAFAADQGGHGGHEEYEYSPYHYEYKVEDDKEYLHFGQEEEDDGKGNVHGHYYVNLPDGRLQHVKYYVNGYSGYVAEVSYDGEASHPSYNGGHVGQEGHGGHGGHDGHDNYHISGQHSLGHHSYGHHSSGSGRFGKTLELESRSVQPVAKSGKITRTQLGNSLHTSSSNLNSVFVPAPQFQGQQRGFSQGSVIQGRVIHHK